MRSNIKHDSTSLLLTDNLILGNLIADIIDKPIIAFQNISNSYILLKELETINVKDIILDTLLYLQ